MSVVACDVAVYNPLPKMLCHYEHELVETLGLAGIAATSANGSSIEVGATSLWGRVRAARRVLGHQGRLVGAERHVLACWPSFGLLEPLLWRCHRGQGRVTIVVHDPQPLRRQFGLGKIAARLGERALNPSLVQVVVHSRPARDVLVELGWPEPTLLPHPVCRCDRHSGVLDGRSRVVLVCGQWKPTRDLKLLRVLGPLLRSHGFSPVIVGPGWASVPGWDVREGFLDEEALAGSIASSCCVIIPYRQFFQSGIAVRALEAHVPVVGPYHPFLHDLLGAEWPGLVKGREPTAWLRAVADAMETSADTRMGVHTLYAERATAAWSTFMPLDASSRGASGGRSRPWKH